MLALAIALIVIAAVLLLPTVSDLIAVARGRRFTDSRHVNASALPSLLVVVPAHDEELMIESCLRSLSNLRYPADKVKIVVVADNCTDRTAELASASGVVCLEREDAQRRGKPWAIAWALDRLPMHAYDALVIIDADSRVDPDFAAGLASAAPLSDKAVQAYNDVSNRTDNALTRMAAVLSAVRFRFMNALKQRAGLNVPLANGLCIGTHVLMAHGWTAFSICEDWEMYVILTAHGVRIENVPAARIFSQEARSLRQSTSQRRRWTAGRLAVLMRYGSTLVRHRLVSAHQKLDIFAELTAPGPAVHLGSVVLMSVLAMVIQVPGAPWIALALWASVIRPVIYTLAALRVDLEPSRAAMAFAFLPLYTIWRLGLQLATVVASGRVPWTRTARRS
jgi:cellulose synthase/poly-beta-1,6-N-acetylglucosamine synthase-like glycosyltransferase